MFYAFIIVPRAGIEPARLAALDFESSASTSSAIWATQNCFAKVNNFLFIANICKVFLIINI